MVKWSAQCYRTKVFHLMCNIINLRIANVNILTVNGQEHFFHLDLTESWEQINIPVISVSTVDGDCEHRLIITFMVTVQRFKVSRPKTTMSTTQLAPGRQMQANSSQQGIAVYLRSNMLNSTKESWGDKRREGRIATVTWEASENRYLNSLTSSLFFIPTYLNVWEEKEVQMR